MMKWFNGNPGPLACEEDLHTRVPVPAGALCQWCEEAIGERQAGFLIPHPGGGFDRSREMPWHRECFIRSIVGSVGHQMRVCSCYGGHAEDPEGLTKREAALAAFTIFENRQNWGMP